MSESSVSLWAKITYGALFVLVLPLALVAWASSTAALVTAPALRSLPVGVLFGLCGAVLLVAGIVTLWTLGGGPPMNLVPPPRKVTQGVYALVPHPIYTGFCLLAIGVAILTGSASGLWLVCPALVLCAFALVLGYEGPELRARFGSDLRAGLRLPEADPTTAPTGRDRLAAYLLVFAPWVVLYEAVVVLGAPHDAVSSALPFERSWPVLEWTELLYASIYPAVALAPWLAKTRRDLRRFLVEGLLAAALAITCYLALPLFAPPRPFVPTSFLGRCITLERSLDGPVASMPSSHVIWALLAAALYAARWPRAKLVWYAFGLGVAVSCVTTGAHSVLDVLAGAGCVWLASRASAIWEHVRRVTERLAGSWREWDFGAVRVINHGGWAALGTFGGVWLVTSLTQGAVLATLLPAFGALIFAGLWAQFIEGSPRLLRPFGFYGGLLGILLGALLAPLAGADVWLVLGAYAVAGPWVQACGRIRCLVQGCCHGGRAPAALGIRYTHPRSRVCRLSDLGGEPLHPTPLYSILWNAVTAIVVVRLWSLHAALHLIGGTYLFLNGIGRFVEESYRAEPQTKIIARLHLYQWLALGCVLAGASLTVLAHSAPAPTPHWSADAVWPALGFATITWFALGVDFPRSHARFSRLV